MIGKLLSNGYVFWYSLAAAVVILGIIYRICNFTFTNYSSRWGCFLLRHNFRLSGKILLWLFFLSWGGVYVYIFVNDNDSTPLNDNVLLGLVGATLLILLLGILSQVLNYCRWCWGTMPLSRIVIVTFVVGFFYGMYLFFTHPAIPDGTIIPVLKKALTLSLKREDMIWRDNFVLSDFQTYISLIRTSDRWRTVLYWFGGICAIHLLLCNAWMHCRGWFKRILAPVLSCLIAFAAVPASVVVGFSCFVVALHIFVIVTTVVVILFALRIFLPIFWDAATTPAASSSSGSYSSGGGSSYSSGAGASSEKGEVITTYTDENWCEYKGKGESPDTVEKQTPGDYATFDKSFDGTKYKERFGDREVEIPWWMR